MNVAVLQRFSVVYAPASPSLWCSCNVFYHLPFHDLRDWSPLSANLRGLASPAGHPRPMPPAYGVRHTKHPANTRLSHTALHIYLQLSPPRRLTPPPTKLATPSLCLSQQPIAGDAAGPSGSATDPPPTYPNASTFDGSTRNLPPSANTATAVRCTLRNNTNAAS